MGTVKIRFRKSSVAGRPGSLYYQLCHEGQVRNLSANIRLSPQYWDEHSRQIVNDVKSDTGGNALLGEYRIKLQRDMWRLRNIMTTLEEKGKSYRLQEVIEAFRNGGNSDYVFSFFGQQIAYCRMNMMLGTARNYRRALNSFKTFLKGNDIPFALITESLIQDYERWLAAKGVVRNSSSFYLRNLRSVYNKAVRCSLTEQAFPFANVFTGTARTRKRAVNEDVILRLLKLDVGYSKPLALSRDLFVFSYCTRGMSFVDISFLRKTDVADGFISYVRRKTGQQLSIRIEPCIERIIKQYEKDTAGSTYVFPIITASNPEAAYRQYQIALNYHNRKLKILGQKIGEALPLSSYTARHTWATTARRHNVPISIISEGMGHSSEKTTQIYLASFENSVIDEANKSILKYINRIVS